MADSSPPGTVSSNANTDVGSKSILAIILSLKPSQLWGCLGVIAALLTGSYALGSFVVGLRSDVAIAKKDLEVSETKRAAHQLEKDKQTLNDALENAKQLTDTQNYQTQHFRVKADFLHRYYSYVVSKENPAELKLFADVVCVLWKRSQEARLNIRPESIFVTPLSVRRGLDQAAKDELSRHGINHDAIAQQLRDIDAQLQRVARAPRVGPFSSPEAERVRRETQSRELQIASELRSATPRKIVTFSDVPYEVPQPVADVVHMRADCAPGR